MKLKGFREALKEGLTVRFGEKAKSLVGLGLNLRPRREGEEDGGAMVNCIVAIFSAGAGRRGDDDEPFWRQRLNVTVKAPPWFRTKIIIFFFFPFLLYKQTHLIKYTNFILNVTINHLLFLNF